MFGIVPVGINASSTLNDNQTWFKYYVNDGQWPLLTQRHEGAFFPSVSLLTLMAHLAHAPMPRAPKAVFPLRTNSSTAGNMSFDGTRNRTNVTSSMLPMYNSAPLASLATVGDNGTLMEARDSIGTDEARRVPLIQKRLTNNGVHEERFGNGGLASKDESAVALGESSTVRPKAVFQDIKRLGSEKNANAKLTELSQEPGPGLTWALPPGPNNPAAGLRALQEADVSSTSAVCQYQKCQLKFVSASHASVRVTTSISVCS